MSDGNGSGMLVKLDDVELEALKALVALQARLRAEAMAAQGALSEAEIRTKKVLALIAGRRNLEPGDFDGLDLERGFVTVKEPAMALDAPIESARLQPSEIIP